ncbi:MAG TPA: response regulator transcription factor [Candidatus Aquilonibacter sp.]|nr:response regulator transcription factor [Candidatus Aquilonibacter sp.]
MADSSRIHTQLLSDALRRDPELEVISWSSGLDGLIAAAVDRRVDVLAISCALDGVSAHGLEVVRQLRAVRPQAKSVVLLDSRKPETVLDAFRSGARGIFSKDGSVEMFCKCIRSVHEGQIWADNRELTMAIEALASTPVVRAVGANGMDLLSKREMEVVRCLSRGLTNREIAKQMGLSQHTVKNYLFRVFDKLGVSSRVELLFMTLSQSSSEESPEVAAPKELADEPDEEATLALFQKAAEAGLPAAQLALAQAYMARRANPDDLVQACMWYMVSVQRASQIRALITRIMTPDQVHEAEQRAEAWLARLKGSPIDLPGLQPSGPAETSIASWKKSGRIRSERQALSGK